MRKHFKGNLFQSISTLKCSDTEHGEVRREAALIPAKTLFLPE